MHNSALSRLFPATIALAIVTPSLTSCASPPASDQRHVRSKIVWRTFQHRIVRLPESGISSGPENIVNPRKKHPQLMASAQNNQQQPK